jgi:hypothetical protein
VNTLTIGGDGCAGGGGADTQAANSKANPVAAMRFSLSSRDATGAA